MKDIELNKEELIELKKWLEGDTIDDPGDLLEEVPTICALIDFWIEHNK